jgi:hypothetical protein
MINAVSLSHIEWLAEALANIDQSNKDLIVSLARLFHMISEYLLKTNNTNLSNLLLDVYLNKNFFISCMTNLSKQIEGADVNQNASANEEVLTNLNARLYIISIQNY